MTFFALFFSIATDALARGGGAHHGGDSPKILWLLPIGFFGLMIWRLARERWQTRDFHELFWPALLLTMLTIWVIGVLGYL